MCLVSYVWMTIETQSRFLASNRIGKTKLIENNNNNNDDSSKKTKTNLNFITNENSMV